MRRIVLPPLGSLVCPAYLNLWPWQPILAHIPLMTHTVHPSMLHTIASLAIHTSYYSFKLYSCVHVHLGCERTIPCPRLTPVARNPSTFCGCHGQVHSPYTTPSYSWLSYLMHACMPAYIHACIYLVGILCQVWQTSPRASWCNTIPPVIAKLNYSSCTSTWKKTSEHVN